MPRLDLDDEGQSPYHPTFPHNEIYKPSLNEEPDFAYGPEVDVLEDDDGAYGPEVDVDFLEETYQKGPNEGRDRENACVFIVVLKLVFINFILKAQKTTLLTLQIHIHLGTGGSRRPPRGTGPRENDILHYIRFM